MRIWSVHPKYLDPQGLVALWREALLARAVLRNETTGYRHHPQLVRFRSHPAPISAINLYLSAVLEESRSRGYSFNAKKVGPVRSRVLIPTSAGQLAYEWQHLLTKLELRAPTLFVKYQAVISPEAHPSFSIVPGSIAAWERGSAVAGI